MPSHTPRERLKKRTAKQLVRAVQARTRTGLVPRTFTPTGEVRTGSRRRKLRAKAIRTGRFKFRKL